MVIRKCPKCNVEFNRKSSYDYHINKKYDCTPSNKNIKVIEEKNNNFCVFIEDKKNVHVNLINDEKKNNCCCSYCGKNYSSKSALTRHSNENCKIKKQYDKEKENKENQEIKENKEKINKLEIQNKILSN